MTSVGMILRDFQKLSRHVYFIPRWGETVGISQKLNAKENRNRIQGFVRRWRSVSELGQNALFYFDFRCLNTRKDNYLIMIV